MKLLFIARHHTYFRNFDDAIRELAARGHRVHLAVEMEDRLGGVRAVERLVVACRGVTMGIVPERRVDTWSGVARRLRLGLDYLRYLDPFYDTATLRRVRARDRTPRALIWLADPPIVGGPRWRAMAARALHALDRSVPPPPSIVEYLRRERPDALIVTPLVDLGSQQIDYVRAARTLGIPTALAVWSWDHLTSKAYLREPPERVLVWNDTQRREAIGTHRVPAERVVVTGAQCFDRWFNRSPSRTRAEFCRQLGLPAERPIVLWVGTGLIKGSPPEPPFVKEWIGWVRASADARVAGASVLIRPHPSKTGGWRDIDWSGDGPVAIWGGNPVDEESRADYFDSLFHSAAVVGLNTSAFIEAGIVGREVLTILAPPFHDNQDGTAHFRYLREIGGGLLRVARDREGHLAQLASALRKPAAEEHPHRVFIEAFVRPRGIDHAATPDFVAAVEALPACPVDVPRQTMAAAWRRAVLGAAARAASWAAGEALVRSPKELDPVRQARIDAALRGQQDRRRG